MVVAVGSIFLTAISEVDPFGALTRLPARSLTAFNPMSRRTPIFCRLA